MFLVYGMEEDGRIKRQVLCMVKVCPCPGRLINAICKSLKETAFSMNEKHIRLVNHL